MRYLVYAAIALMTVVFWYGVVCITQDVLGSEVSLGASVRWNCTNFFTSPHPIPVSMTNENGSWDVLLEDGSMLYGTMVTDTIQKWTLDDMTWMTNGVDVVYCESDVRALSILMAK